MSTKGYVGQALDLLIGMGFTPPRVLEYIDNKGRVVAQVDSLRVTAGNDNTVLIYRAMTYLVAANAVDLLVKDETEKAQQIMNVRRNSIAAEYFPSHLYVDLDEEMQRLIRDMIEAQDKKAV